MPIDYSKWDNLEVSSSDDDDDDKPTPHVTRLDAPSRVTFGGGTGGAMSASTSASKSPPLDCSYTEGATTVTTSHSKSVTPAGDQSAPSSWTDRGGLLEIEKTAYNPSRNLYWAQDRYAVTLRLELRGMEKVRSVCVEGILPYRDRWSAVGSTKLKLSCTSSADSLVLLEGDLPHPVHLAEEDSDDGLVDWSVVEADHQPQSRFLTITLHKAVPMQGLSVWWRRPLMRFSEADLDSVRRGSSHSSSSSASAVASDSKGASGEFLEAWEEAHKIFRKGKQKRAEMKPVI